MERGGAQVREQLAENPNPEFMALLLNIQRQLDEQATMIQQQAVMIQNLQQQQGGVANLGHEIPEDGEVSTDIGKGSNEHRGNGMEDSPLGAPRGVKLRIGRNPQPQPVRRKYLGERLCKMKSPLCEEPTNPLDAEEHWVKRMHEMFQPNISFAIEGVRDPPTMTTDCGERTDRVEHCLNQLKERRRCIYENRKKQGDQGRNHSSDNRNRNLQDNLQQEQNKNNNKRKGK